MKKILILAALALGAMAVSAQSVGGGRSSGGNSFFSTEKADHGVTFGIRGGLNIAGLSHEFIKSYGDEYSFKNAIGFNAGINIDIPVVKSFYVQTGAYFTSKNAKIEETWYDK
ncbi:MAG: outer membrane beta-barrel protein, partial [Muribaculaceae bacterium]|nr:outer membrane beta-barrel protein [Muribaculaceae bacterium]